MNNDIQTTKRFDATTLVYIIVMAMMFTVGLHI